VLGVLSIVLGFVSLGTVIDALLTTRILVQFIGQIGAVTLLRRRAPDMPRPYRMWLYPLPSLVALLGWIFIFATTPPLVIAFGSARCCWACCALEYGRGNNGLAVCGGDMTNEISRRDFLVATASLAAASQLPIGSYGSPQATAATGSVVVFQGDSITDSGRNRDSADPNSAGALGNGYPLLVASAVLAARPDGGLRFYNRGISGNKVPDLQQRWTSDTVDLHPDVLSILIGVNDFWHKLDHGYNGTVQDYDSSTPRCWMRRAAPCRACI